MSSRSAKERIQDMLNAIGSIQSCTDGMSFDEFSQNETIVKAVLYDLIVIGEAAINIPFLMTLPKSDRPLTQKAIALSSTISAPFPPCSHSITGWLLHNQPHTDYPRLHTAFSPISLATPTDLMPWRSQNLPRPRLPTLPSFSKFRLNVISLACWKDWKIGCNWG
ncbi:MAG: DUF86 domain-containing protein [Cyanothece sp. SIO2G6]|nr:DUF86 domain-containing protein [Cyanothece sp. SIO2G6]